MVHTRYIGITEWERLIEQMMAKIPDKKKYTGVFGVPRGGTLISVYVSEKYGMKLLHVPEKGCLIVDDLIDSGATKKKYEMMGYNDFKVLITKKSNDEWIEYWYEETDQDSKNLITRTLEYIGENPKREGLLDTPVRVMKMYKEVFRGYNNELKPKLTVFPNNNDGVQYDEMIMDSGNFYSMCEHHMIPFFGEYYFAYIPQKKIIGLSKVARIVDYYSSKLQVQERLVKEILDEIEKELQPLGIALVMKARHLCKEMRGIRKKGVMITSDMRGVFRTKPEARSEFMGFINNGGTTK